MSLELLRNYFVGRDVLPSELNAQQLEIERAIARTLAKRGAYGLTVPAVVVDNGTGDFNISISGTEAVKGFDVDGNYVELPSTPLVVDLTGLFTVPPTAGFQRWLTVVMRPARVDSQTERERVSFTNVDFLSTLSYEIAVLEGAELGTPPVKPVLTAETGIVLADILIDNGDVDFTTNGAFDQVAGRYRLEPLAEAVARGLDGVDSKITIGTTGAVPAIVKGHELIFMAHSDGVTIVRSAVYTVPASAKFLIINTRTNGVTSSTQTSYGHFVLELATGALKGHWGQALIGSGVEYGNSVDVTTGNPVLGTTNNPGGTLTLDSLTTGMSSITFKHSTGSPGVNGTDARLTIMAFG